MPYAHAEIERIRSLGEQVAAVANEPRMTAIKKRWADVNALRKPDRAPVWCRPVGCWSEIITDDMLQCADRELRNIELRFLKILHKRDIDDDEPVEPYLAIDASYRVEPPNLWGVDLKHEQPAEAGGAWKYDPPLKDESDYEKLRIPTFSYNIDAEGRRLEALSELLDGIMEVRLEAIPPLRATLGTAAAELRGLEQMMMDMITEPELMHRLMAHLRDANLASLDQLEATGLLTPNNIGPMNCSDPIGPSGETTFANMWCMANAQEFDQVSPAMWEEFCLEYQKPVFERYGLVGYGCCENLTHKIDGVLTIPNLRIFTCSAWTDLSVIMEKVGKDYCIMWRQKASDVVFPDDLQKVRQDLLEGTRQLQGHYYQVVLRELQTLAGHPARLHEWTQYAKEAAEKYA